MLFNIHLCLCFFAFYPKNQKDISMVFSENGLTYTVVFSKDAILILKHRWKFVSVIQLKLLVFCCVTNVNVINQPPLTIKRFKANLWEQHLKHLTRNVSTRQFNSRYESQTSSAINYLTFYYLVSHKMRNKIMVMHGSQVLTEN